MKPDLIIKYVLRIFIWCIFLVAILIFKTHIPLGVDIEVYSSQMQGQMPKWTFYNGKEFISWSLLTLIGFITTISPNVQLIILDLMVIFLLYAILKRFALSTILLPVIFISPVLVLLSNNILRQYIALPFLLGFLLSATYWRLKASIFFGLLAFFAHNSSLILILIFIIGIAIWRKPIIGSVIALVFALLLLSIRENLYPILTLLDRSTMLDDESIAKNIVYLAYFQLVVLGFMFFGKFKISKISNALSIKYFNPKVTINLIHIFPVLLICGFIAEMFLVIFPVIYVNRLIISLTAIALVVGLGMSKFISNKYSIQQFIYFISLSFIALVSHDGALKMLYR